jgi:hypothetical protein
MNDIIIMAKLLVLGTALFWGCLSCSAQTADHSLALGCKEGNLNEESPVTKEKMISFLNQLKEGLKGNEKGQVAGMMSYPLLISTEAGHKQVRSEKEFLAEYARIITPPLKSLLLKQQPECVSRVGAQGFTISRGEIWFNEFPDGAVKIFTITPVVMPDE